MAALAVDENERLVGAEASQRDRLDRETGAGAAVGRIGRRHQGRDEVSRGLLAALGQFDGGQHVDRRHALRDRARGRARASDDQFLDDAGRLWRDRIERGGRRSHLGAAGRPARLDQTGARRGQDDRLAVIGDHHQPRAGQQSVQRHRHRQIAAHRRRAPALRSLGLDQDLNAGLAGELGDARRGRLGVDPEWHGLSQSDPGAQRPCRRSGAQQVSARGPFPFVHRQSPIDTKSAKRGLLTGRGALERFPGGDLQNDPTPAEHARFCAIHERRRPFRMRQCCRR